MRYERQRDPRRIEDTGIRAESFGGLNTTANPLTIPYEDSPSLLNVDIGIGGHVEKRKGTKIVGSLASQAVTHSYPARSALGYNYLIRKEEFSLIVSSVVNDVDSVIRTFPNVFSTKAKPSFLSISDLESRILILTGKNCPVHVRLVEQAHIQPAPSTTVVIQNASRFEFEQPILYINRQRVVSPPVPVYNPVAKTLTYTGLPLVAGGIQVDLVLPVWQWWAESFRYFGDRFYDATSRFNVTKADQNVSVPEKLRSDIDVVNKVYGAFPIQLYSNNQVTAGTPFSATGQPGDANTYGWGDGAVYNIGANNFLSASPFFATFGDARTPTPQPAETLHMIRRRELRFNGGDGLLASSLNVRVDGVASAIGLTPGTPTGTRAVRTFQAAGADVTVLSQKAFYLSFDASFPIGVGPTSVVDYTNALPQFIGTAALADDRQYKNGSYWRAYGFGLFADYRIGDFPTTAAIFQGRLALGGFAFDASRVILSSTSDTVEPGVKYNFYQINDDLDGLDTDPFDIVVSSTLADDFVTGLVEWSNSLFVMTRRAAFRVFGGDAPVSPTRRIVNLVSSLGLINPYSFVRTDQAVYYLSDSGVYSLNPQVADGEYLANEKSIKVRAFFEQVPSAQLFVDLSWMAFDPVKKVVYTVIPRQLDDTTSSLVLVYGLIRESWTQYDTIGGFNTYTGHPYTDEILGDNFLFVVQKGKTRLLKLNAGRYADFVSVVSGVSGTSFTNPDNTNISFTVTATTGVQQYDLPPWLPVIPYENVRDLFVTINNVATENWVKSGKGIYITGPLTGGQTIKVSAKMPVRDSFQGDMAWPSYVSGSLLTWANNVFRPDAILTGTTIGFQAPALSGARLEIGYSYPSWFISPLFTVESLKALKKVKHVYLYFDNQGGRDAYKVEDLAPGQSVDELVGRWKTRANASVAVTYDSNTNAERSNDIYQFSEITWDSAVFDIDPTQNQYDAYSLFKEPLMGAGYNYQVGVWSYDEATWKLCGYQVDGRMSGERYTNLRS